MPPVIALVVTLVASLGSAIGAGIAAGGFIEALTIGALTMGAELALGGIMHLIKGSTDLSIQSDTATQSVTIKQAASPRFILYGKGSSGGVLTYRATTGANAEFLHFVVTYFGHECDSVIAHMFDDYQLVLDGSGNEIGKFAGGFVSVEVKLGAPGEAAFPGLIADTAGLGASAWTSSCRQDGCLSVHYKLKYSQNLFPSGVPRKFGIVAKGKKVFDPRTSTTAWSDNQALCTRDWITDRMYGFGFDSATEVNDALYIAAANLADEAVPLLAGGTHARYTTNGVQDSSKMRGDILKALLVNEASGKHGYIAGKSCLWLGAYRAPTLSFNEDDLRGSVQLTGRTSRDSLYNAVRGVYVEPAAGYQVVDFPALVNPQYVAEDSGFPGTTNRGRWATATTYNVNDAVFNRGNAYVCINGPHVSGPSIEPGAGGSWPTYWVLCTEIHWKDVEYQYVNTSPEAQRMAKMDLEYGRRMFQSVQAMKLSAYQLQPPDVFQWNFSAMGWVNKTFEVGYTKLLQDTGSSDQQGGPYLGVDATIKETDAGVFAWTILDEQAQSGFPAVSVQDPTVCQPVTNLTCVSGAATVVTQSDGVKRPRIHVTWDSPTDQFVLAGGKIFADLKKHSPEYSWSPESGVTITTGQTDPDGGTTAIQVASTVASHGVIQATSVNSAPGTPQTVSVWLKCASGTQSVSIGLQRSGGGTTETIVETVDSTWRRYEFTHDGTWGGVSALSLLVFPNGSPQTFFVAFGQVQVFPWTQGDELDGVLQETYLAGVDDGSAYDVRVRARNVAGVYSPYAFVEKHPVSVTTSHINQEALTSSTIGNKNSTIVGGVSPLSATDAGSDVTIGVAAFQLQFGFGRVSYSSGSILHKVYDKPYFVYFSDPSLAGGAVTYIATLDLEDVTASRDNIYVGSIGTPSSGGTGTSGGDLPGGCCCIDMWLNDRDVVEVSTEGDVLDCYLGGEAVEPRMLEQAGEAKWVPCVALIAENGAEWRGSCDTTVHPWDSEPCFAQYAHRALMKTWILQEDGSRKLELSRIVRVEPLGYRWVRQFYIGKLEFAAGADYRKLMFSHNSVAPPDSK